MPTRALVSVPEFLKAENLPQHLHVASAASLSTYGGEDATSNNARVVLDNSEYQCAKIFEDQSLSLRMEVWEDKEGNVVFAYRGTIPTSQNLFADMAITKYAACDGNSLKPLDYLGEHLRTHVKNWQGSGFIPESEFIDTALTHFLPSTSLMENVKKYGSPALGGLGGYGLSTLPFSLTPFGATVVTGIAIYGTYKLVNGHYVNDQAEAALVNANRKALLWTSEIIESCGSSRTYAATGHSLGGFVANTVVELIEKPFQSCHVFNAPGGVESFLRAQKKYLLGEKDDWFTWSKKAIVLVQEDFPHDWHGLTTNITRASCIVGRVGGDNRSRQSILIPDHPVLKPLSFGEYGLANHSIAHMATHLHPELYKEE